MAWAALGVSAATLRPVSPRAVARSGQTASGQPRTKQSATQVSSARTLNFDDFAELAGEEMAAAIAEAAEINHEDTKTTKGKERSTCATRQLGVVSVVSLR